MMESVWLELSADGIWGRARASCFCLQSAYLLSESLCEELFAEIWFSFHPLNRFAVDEILLVSTEAAAALMFATWNNKVATNSIANFFFRPRACANRRANHRSTRDFVLCINSFERFESNTHKSSNPSPFYNRRVSIFARDKSICDCWGWSGKEKDFCWKWTETWHQIYIHNQLLLRFVRNSSVVRVEPDVLHAGKSLR